MNKNVNLLKYLLMLMIVGMVNICLSQELFLKKVNITDGLLGFDNYKMIEDKDGVIWVCSENGVVKFEGNKHKKFTSTNGLFINDVWQISADPIGRIWLRSYAAGVQYIKNDSVFTVKNSTKYDEVQFAGYHRDTCFLTVKTKKGFQRFFLDKQGELRHYNRFESLGLEVKGDFSQYGFFLLYNVNEKEITNYYYWIASNSIEDTHSLFGNLTSKEFEDEAPVYHCYYGKAIKNRNFGLFVPTNKGFVEVVPDIGKKISRYDVFDFDSKNVVIKLNGDVLVYSDILNGIRNREVEQIISNYFESRKDIGGLLVDKKGNIWVVRIRGEVFFIHSSAFWASILDLQEENKWNMEISKPIKWKREGQIIYMTHRAEVYYTNYISGEKKLLYKCIGSLREIKLYDGKLYILGSAVLVILELTEKKGSISILSKKEYPILGEIYEGATSFEILDPRTVLIASGYLLKISKSNTCTIEKLKNYHPLFRTEKIIYANGLIAASSKTKCYFFDLKEKKEVSIPVESPSCINYIKGNLYIGTYGNGFYRLDSKTFKLIRVFNFKEDILNIRYKDGIYLCTSNGILFGEIKNDQFKVLKTFLNIGYFSLRTNDVLVSNNLLALTNRGTIHIDLEKRYKYLEKWHSIDGLRFDLTATNDMKLLKSGELLEYNHNSINFSLDDNSFFNISSAVYRYRLIGRNSQWKYTENGTISFANLRAGEYKLIVESSTSKYGKFGNRKSFKFQVGKPFYATELFIVGAIILTLILLIGVNYIVRYFAFRKAQRQSKLKELEYQALQAQLNPHFVFNCLNNLQRMMILSDEREVNEYICSFAGLMRNVLDNSKRKKIFLREEIELLENYLRIEQIRFSGTLKYSILVPENIDTSKIEVYGMVFQPFVENAIIHGFMTNQPTKQIDIKFELIEENILCGTVTDNGIGRDNAQQLKKKGIYKSWSSSILKEKSELLNISRKNELSFEIIDLYSENVGIGTKIEVKMRID